ncbi:ABC transporter permease [Bifidobacterium dentium]|uniref:ABC transporter permease n=1 Tax=Bifidobacterium dentium TaxID=1689 RepID=UPI0022DF7240|nr:FtsX-like permease family protein [Bifidobacterium dentium]
MVKRILWKDIRQTLSGSIGRFVSIVCLMALGSFALVGLKVAGPDMQATGAEFYGRNNLADVTVVSTYGLSEDDKDVIGRADGVRGIEYGYFKDVVIKGTDSSMRVFSKPEYISTYDVVEGRMPKRQGEIVLDLNQRSAFAVGSTLDVTEKADISGSTVLRHHRFEVVGFVRASEIVSGLNMGQSTSGSGTLTSYAVAMPSEFDSEVTMIARIVYNDTEHLNYWTDDYRDRIQKHKDQLVKLLAGQPEARESSIREQQQEKIDQARQQVKDSEQQLDDARTQLELTKTMLDQAAAMLNKMERVGTTGAVYEQLKQRYETVLGQYNTSVQEYNERLEEYNNGLQQYQDGVNQLEQGSQEYQNNADNLAQASNLIANKQAQLGQVASQAGSTAVDGAEQLIEGQRSIEKAEEEYESKLAEFNSNKPKAEKKIAEAKTRIELAQEQADNLTVPAYSVSGRREGLTSQGYRVYMVIVNIIGKLANIFPIFLYFVAALVTFTTMGRMVDEERTNSGTLKALGYTNGDVMLKFTVYGFTASTIGTVIGVLAGHTVLPLIVEHAYSSGFTMPSIKLGFHPWVTLVSFLLAWMSAVVPTWIVASRELREKPAALLLSKPPAKGSKIFLERVTPIWNRLNFTRKVTARNIFRYKMRMFMTIFGVCGAVSLLTAGLGVQASIGQIGERQLDELIHYDLIAVEQSSTNSAQIDELKKALNKDSVSSSIAAHYEELSKTSGKNSDKQQITLLATDDAYNFGTYLTLRDRSSHEKRIMVNDGAIISERLSEMLHVSVGDSFSVTDAGGVERTVKVSGICEMYIGHFVFMNAQCYEKMFGTDYSENSYMVRLKDSSVANAERQGARLMKLSAVQSVVQNTTQKNMVSTIVESLNQIMEVLIIVAVMLAVVILYNLTNLNVSERIRELSTIKVLGFHTNETTMYIYRETMLLSGLGILAGYGFGAWLHGYIVTEVPPDEVMFDPALGWKAFVVPLLVVGVVLAVLGWVVYRRLKTVDMLAALKSVE